jgi:hypothetical protein
MYAECRTWARWLGVFTASDLANVMGVSVEVGERGVTALLHHGICERTGEFLDGPDGELEEIIGYVPLPDGPSEHWTDIPPEIQVGYTEILSPRGVPVTLGVNTSGKSSRSGFWRPGRRNNGGVKIP